MMVMMVMMIRSTSSHEHAFSYSCNFAGISVNTFEVQRDPFYIFRNVMI